MKDRQFKSIEDVEDFRKRIKKDKKRNVTDDEYNALDRHLINLYADAMDGDKQAVSKLYLFADSLLKGKQAASAIRSKSGSKKGKAKERKILLLAIAMRRKFIKGKWTTYKWNDERRDDYHLIMPSVEEYIYDVTDENDSIRELIEDADDREDIFELIQDGKIDKEYIREELLEMIRVESIVVQEADRWSAVVEKVIEEAPTI